MKPPAAQSTPPLPGMKTATADADRSARKTAKSWTDQEKEFSSRCLATWNEAFRHHGTRANDVHRNRFAANQLFRFLTSDRNDGEKMTVEDVQIAIRAYSNDPHNAKHCNGRYKTFHDWMSDCPDAVDKQLARIGKRRGAKAVTPEAKARSERFDKAIAFIRGRDWDAIAKDAAQGKRGLREYIASLRVIASRYQGSRGRDELLRLDKLLADIDAFDALRTANRPAWVAIRNYATTPLASLPDGYLKVNLRDALTAEMLAQFGVAKAAEIAAKVPIPDAPARKASGQ